MSNEANTNPVSVPGNIAAMVAVAVALKHYRPGGMLMNKAYTLKNMLATATKYTGKKYKRTEYALASTDLYAAAEARVKGNDSERPR